MDKVLLRMKNGGGRQADIDNLWNIATGILGNTICPLGDAAALPVFSYLKKYREEFESHVRFGKCHDGEFGSWQPAKPAGS